MHQSFEFVNFCRHESLAVDPSELLARCDQCGALLEGIDATRAVLGQHIRQQEKLDKQAADLVRTREMVLKMASRLMDLGEFD